ncbi:uncharacterized protein LOC116292211 [Actinia tenebrosa]|uniref:Uncharacterized protein LOC116292211 n=1 Tax=Actinia tenebrosa TaxID=6105 RepID=A0A6P8HRQ6_ACTTE|nr:uncharacterized protein LOC116292211 [Actinia tenebrosa]
MVCITNDDKVEFDFLYSNMTVEENMRYISIPINKTGRSAIPVNFRLTMDDKSYSTAIRGVDYEDRHGNIITFPASDQQLSTMYVNVTIKMDGKAESSEVFSVGLEAVDSSTSTIGSKNTMVVKITDKKDNDDFAAREMQRDQDEKKRTDTLFLILYLTVAFAAVIIIILIMICVLIIKKLKKEGK